jgi:hypothetical protein
VLLRRTEQLQEWLSALLDATATGTTPLCPAVDHSTLPPEVISFLEAGGGVSLVAPGAPWPHRSSLVVEDLYGRIVRLGDFGDDWTLVVSAASRYNFNALIKVRC